MSAPSPFLAVIAVVLGALLGGCQRASQSSPVDISREDFGSGVSLMTDEAEARRIAAEPTAVSIKVMTPDELLDENPFGRSNGQQDLIIAIPRPLESQPGQVPVMELRCYAASAGTKLQLLGQPFSSLDPDSADRLLQQKGQRLQSASETHVDYTFGYGKSKMDRSLTLSFRTGTGCYAAKLRIDSPKEFPR